MAKLLSMMSRTSVRVALVIFACFLQASTGWLVWLYHLTPLAASLSVETLTMVVGYLMQAVGMGTFIFLGKRWVEGRTRRIAMGVIGAYAACLACAVISSNLAIVLAFGYLANVLCGFVQGFYGYCLARYVDEGRRGTVFGGAYAAATAAGWLLSIIAGGILTHGVVGVVTCVVLGALCVVLMRLDVAPAEDAAKGADAAPARGEEQEPRLTTLACGVVLLVSLTKNAGFGFPTADLLAGVNLESSRLFYGVGLIMAGLVSDKDRRYGASVAPVRWWPPSSCWRFRAPLRPQRSCGPWGTCSLAFSRSLGCCCSRISPRVTTCPSWQALACSTAASAMRSARRLR